MMIKKVYKKIKGRLSGITKALRFNMSSKKHQFQPVFLIGCGRSGTTILGNTIEKHESITYLNERRDLWHQAYPELDIWSGKIANPKLIVDLKNSKSKQTKKLNRLFYQEQIAGDSTILLEKLPINNFRLSFIEKAFPNAKYIYLHRNGIEVAKSIEKSSDHGKWFGKNNIKWNLIEKLLKEPGLSKPVDFSNFEKGLIEWKFSLDFSQSFFSKLDKNRYYSLSYQTFLENPKLQIENIYRFLDLDFNDNIISKITQNIRRRSEKIHNLDENYLKIGGPNLKLSIENQIEQTAPNNVYSK